MFRHEFIHYVSVFYCLMNFESSKYDRSTVKKYVNIFGNMVVRDASFPKIDKFHKI